MKKILFIFLSVTAFLPSVFARPQSYNQKLEAKINILINQVRIKHGLKPFRYSKKLAQIAHAYSQDMAARDFTSHYTPEGLSPWDRAKNAGFNIYKKEKGGIRKGVGENLYQHWTWKESSGGEKFYYVESLDKVAQAAVVSWMNSPEHRDNILNPDYTMTGIGVSVSKDKKIRIIQEFF